MPEPTASAERLGSTQRRDGRYRAAGVSLRQELAEAESIHGPNSVEVALALNELGMLLKYTGGFDEAEQCYLRALRILERVGEHHPLRADLLHNLGGVDHARGRYEDAEVWARAGLGAREAALGSEPVAVAADFGALASILEAQGRLDEAEALLSRALAVFSSALGPHHHEVAVSLSSLAAIRVRQRRWAEAEELARQALRLKELGLGAHHPQLAPTLNILALALKNKGDVAGAESCLERAVNVLEAAVEPDHPGLAACRQNRQSVQALSGPAESARAWPR